MKQRDRRTHRAGMRVPRENASHTARSHVTHRASLSDCGDYRRCMAVCRCIRYGSFRIHGAWGVAKDSCTPEISIATQPAIEPRKRIDRILPVEPRSGGIRPVSRTATWLPCAGNPDLPFQSVADRLTIDSSPGDSNRTRLHFKWARIPGPVTGTDDRSLTGPGQSFRNRQRTGSAGVYPPVLR